jgi:hypothetical protein
MNHRAKQGKDPRGVSAIDLGKANVESLAVRVRTFAGVFEIGGAPPRSRELSIGVRGVAGDSAVGYRFDVSGKKAVLDWPQTSGGFGIPPPGAGVDVRIPEMLPVTLSWRGRFASMRADLRRLKLAGCSLHEIASSIRMDLGDAGRPEEIQVGGFASSILIRIPADCPVRLMSRTPFLLTALPSDFVEHARGRGKDRTYASEGRGRAVRITVAGWFIRIKLERLPSTAV